MMKEEVHLPTQSNKLNYNHGHLITSQLNYTQVQFYSCIDATIIEFFSGENKLWNCLTLFFILHGPVNPYATTVKTNSP